MRRAKSFQPPRTCAGYRVLTRRNRQPVDTLHVHVLARAYDAAWRARHQSAPVGEHVIEGLGLVIDFGGALHQ